MRANDGATAGTAPLVLDANPSRVVSWRGARAVTLGEFLAHVARVAAVLPAAPGFVNLCHNRYAFTVAFAAVLSRGASNLLPPTRTPRAIAEVLDAHPGSIALCDRVAADLPPGCIVLPDLDHGIDEGGVAPAVPQVASSLVAAIGYTSGSTGTPVGNRKGWGGFHLSSANNAAAIAAAVGLAPGARASVLATVPPQHMYGVEMSVLLPLLGPFAVSDRHPLLPGDIASALAELPPPRVLVTTPVHLRALLAADPDLPVLAAVVSATAPLDAELAAAVEARWSCHVLEFFGSTETSVIGQRRTACQSEWRPYPGVRLEAVPEGTRVHAPWLLEASKTLADVMEGLPDGRFRLLGRRADLLEIAGKRASLGDLTHRVLGLRGVIDAAVFQAEAADRFGVRRIAALVVAPGRSEAELLAELREAIDPAFLPRPLRLVERLPRNDTGKLPRAALLAALEADEA